MKKVLGCGLPIGEGEGEAAHSSGSCGFGMIVSWSGKFLPVDNWSGDRVWGPVENFENLQLGR